jgi:SAM-dependent methyltransferase
MSTTNLNDIIQWDIRAWGKALNYWENQVDWNNVHSALELGAREGGLSLWLSQKGISTICSDFMDTEERATPLHSKYNSSSNIKYQDIDATNIPYENQFDVIIFKSIIGGIGKGDNLEQQEKVFSEIHKALKPGGKLLFAENLTSTMLHQKLRARHNKWGGYWRYISLTELKHFLNSFDSSTIKTTGVLGTLGRSEKQKGFLSRVDEISMNHITPSKWHYIGYGIAKKK